MEIKSILTSSITLLDIIKEDEETYTYKFNIPQGTTWEAGTNAHLVARGNDRNFTPSKEHMRHFSICSLPEEGYMGFSTRIRNNASTFKENLRVVKPGDKLQVYGLKNRLPLERNNQTVVLISMGVGIATMRPILLAAAKNPIGLHKVININIDKKDKRIYGKELDQLSSLPIIFSHYTHSRQAFFHVIDQTINEANAEFHIVGSDEFIEDTARHLISKNVDKTQIRLDKKPARTAAILEALEIA